jgi:hypothetical protein
VTSWMIELLIGLQTWIECVRMWTDEWWAAMKDGVTPVASKCWSSGAELDRTESSTGQVVVDGSVAERGPENPSASAEPFAVDGTRWPSPMTGTQTHH